MPTKKKAKKKVTKKVHREIAFQRALRASYRKEMRRQNAAFMKLSPEARRVSIARDTIEQIRLGKLKPEYRVFCVPEKPAAVTSVSEERGFVVPQDKSTEFKEILKNSGTCCVCALGGMFAATVVKLDRLKISEFNKGSFRTVSDSSKGPVATVEPHWSEITTYLKKFFSLEQLKLIEVAFERGHGANVIPSFRPLNNPRRYDRLVEAKFFLSDLDSNMHLERDQEHELQLNAADSLRLIMENIVSNNGTFVPSKRPHTKVIAVTPGFNDGD